MRSDRQTIHVGDPLDAGDAAWWSLPDGTAWIAIADASESSSSEGSSSDGGVDAAAHRTDTGDRDDGDGTAPVVAVRLSEGDDHADRLRRVRARFPDAPTLAYSARDDPDAAIDASRLGIEYVSGRRLAADGETLADRIGEVGSGGDARGRRAERDRDAERREERDRDADHGFLEPFLRIVSDRRATLDEQIDALLDLGRSYLGLSIGYSSRLAGDRLEIQRYSDGTGILDPIAGDGGDGSVPLELTYCRRTVSGRPADDGGAHRERSARGSRRAAGESETDDRGRGGRPGVFAFIDPEAAGLDGDPAYERFGFGSYVGGRVVVDEEVFGTICFLDPESRDRPFDAAEELFVELLAEWLGRAIERRLAFEQREAAVERFENTLDRIDDAFFALDDDWRFTYVNEKAATLLDRPAEELVGANVWEEFPDAIGETYETSYRRAMETQESVSFAERYEPLDLWAEVTAYPSPDGLSVFFSDVTERIRREETLERLLRTAERIQRDADAEAVADRLIDAANDILGYGVSAVRLRDDDGLLRMAATSDGVGDRYRGREPRAPGEGVVGEVYERGETAVWTDLTERDDGREYHGMRSLVGVPLGDHGVFVVGSTEPDAFDESDVSVVELLAMNATATLDAQRRQRRLRTYENALKNVDDMVCVLDDDGTVTYATDPFAAWLGTDAFGLVGSPLGAVLPESDAAERVATAVDALGVERRSDGSYGRVRSVELTVDRAGDARPRHGELRLSALSGADGGVVGTLSDTTDLRRTRTELSRERDRFDQLFERLPDPVMEVVIGPEETVIAGVNPAFASRFGYDAAALRGRRIDALDIHDDRLSDASDRARAEREGERTDEASLDERVREEGFVTAEVHRRTVDGPREFLFRGFTYETDGDRRAFAIYTDITDRKRRERYFRVVNRILRHNLRNELNVVFGFASEIAKNTEEELTADYARRIETTGKRLADLAEGAAEIKRVVEEGIANDLDPVSVSRAAAAVREEYAERYPEAQIGVAVPDDVSVRGDDRLAEALGHLVENAVVHSRGDAPRVEITAERHPETGTVSVRVADDGPGIPDGVRGVITGETEVTQLTHNTGIGLWIVAWVVEAYGGEVAFGPGIDGEGTTVTLRLPAAE